MPSKSLRTFLLEVTLIVVMISVVGHLTVNFWERYFMKTELAQMKDSLHALKNTLFNIGNAYDALHVNIKNLAENTSKMRSAADCMKCKNKLDRRRLHDMKINAIIDTENTYTRRYNLMPNPVIKAEAYCPTTSANKELYPVKNYNYLPKLTAKEILDSPAHKYKKVQTYRVNTDTITTNSVNHGIETKVAEMKTTDVKVDDVSTMTRYPRVSSGVGVNSDDLNNRDIYQHRT